MFWALLVCNVLVPQVLWSGRARRTVWLLFAVSLIVNAGMWMERMLIVVQSMHQDFMPSSWGLFVSTRWDWTFLAGSIGFFAFLFLLFVRLLPAISIFEMRRLIREERS